MGTQAIIIVRPNEPNGHIHYSGHSILTKHYLDVHLFSPAALNFPMRPNEYAMYSVPSINDFEHLWTAWDIVTKAMVPREALLSQPIKLRNTLIFYLGHIPTFFGMN